MTLEELKRLEAAATPGPWFRGPYRRDYVEIDCGPEPRLRYDSWNGLAFCNGAEDNRAAGMAVAGDNAALIAAMRNALPDLIAAVEALRDLRNNVRAVEAWDQCEAADAILKRLGVE